jgi:uncharacterized membrane-anchored protein YhcB (DUF1043 family)
MSSNQGAPLRSLVIALLVGLLIGFIPMWLRARQRTGERDQALENLRKSELHNELLSAALDSRRGQYETARKELSQFFTSLSAVADQKNDVDLTPEQRKAFQPMLSGRDELITLLARNDPASADRLSALDVAFRKALAQH